MGGWKAGRAGLRQAEGGRSSIPEPKLCRSVVRFLELVHEESDAGDVELIVLHNSNIHCIPRVPPPARRVNLFARGGLHRPAERPRRLADGLAGRFEQLVGLGHGAPGALPLVADDEIRKPKQGHMMSRHDSGTPYRPTIPIRAEADPPREGRILEERRPKVNAARPAAPSRAPSRRLPSKFFGDGPEFDT